MTVTVALVVNKRVILFFDLLVPGRGPIDKDRANPFDRRFPDTVMPTTYFTNATNKPSSLNLIRINDNDMAGKQ